MKTTLATLTLCLVVLMATGFPFDRKGGSAAGGGSKEKRVQYAAWDDVNVIAHGLLQLGQGLKEHVDKTKVQMRDVSTKLKVFNRTMTDLAKESQKLRVEGEALKGRARELEDREGQLLNVTAELREKAEEMQLERRAMSDRMSRLEERVDSLLQGGGVLPDLEAGAKNSSDARHIQVMLENQNRRIDDLLERIRLQQEKLDKQNVRIRTLQSQVVESRNGDASVEQSDSPIVDAHKPPKPPQPNLLLATDLGESTPSPVSPLHLLSTVQALPVHAPAMHAYVTGLLGRALIKVQEREVEALLLNLSCVNKTASDCHELFLRGETTSGVYTIQPVNAEPFKVFCEMTADGGWTVIQRRQDGSLDFDQLWEAYVKGFGSLTGESWLGLEKIHSIAKDGGYILNIQLSDWNGDVASVKLPFSLGGGESKYSLQVRKDGPFSPLERSLGADVLHGLPFSTRDQDNDQKNDTNCAKHLSGGWWFSSCGHSNLNGRYFQSPPPKHRHQRKQGIFWKSWRGRYYPLKNTVMLIAPVSVQSKS
ncbi:Angiopoietin-related protein 4 [Takifugu flavidus]|uniref:Angiopoietin-related protein 4 n=1 Tax=Takifugu flavidus TaxID=433684 RepID=A0A5C6P1E9_9TELE|nr:Angiopoietin-related protein 4 [Takifugu flavidus]